MEGEANPSYPTSSSVTILISTEGPRIHSTDTLLSLHNFPCYSVQHHFENFPLSYPKHIRKLSETMSDRQLNRSLTLTLDIELPFLNFVGLDIIRGR